MLRLALAGHRLPRSAADLRPVLDAGRERHLRGPLPVRLSRHAGAGGAQHGGRRCPRSPTAAGPGRSGSSRASCSPPTPRSRASRASSSPRTTSIRSSAGSTPTSSAAATPRSPISCVGARPVVDAARKSGKLDYDAKIEGLQAIDRHTLRLKLDRRRLHDTGAARGPRHLRRRARSGRGGRRRRRGPAGRHGPVPVARVEARLEGGARRQPELPAAGVSRQQRSGAAAAWCRR